MPILHGRGAVSKNISIIMNDYESSGKIGSIIPRNKNQAHKIAVAIAMDAEKQAKSKKRKR